MHALNLESDGMIEALNHFEVNRRTVVYKMLRLERRAEETSNWQADRVKRMIGAGSMRVSLAERSALARSYTAHPLRKQFPGIMMGRQAKTCTLYPEQDRQSSCPDYGHLSIRE
jgi:hypothetical protein